MSSNNSPKNKGKQKEREESIIEWTFLYIPIAVAAGALMWALRGPG